LQSLPNRFKFRITW